MREYLTKFERIEPSKSSYGLLVYKARLTVAVAEHGEHMRTDVWDGEVWKDPRRGFAFYLFKNDRELIESQPFDTTEARRQNKASLADLSFVPELFGLLFGTWAAKIAPGYAKASSRKKK